MKKIRKMVVATFTNICLLTSTVSVYAQDIFAEGKLELNQIYKDEEMRRIEETMNAEDSKKWIGVVRENVPLFDSVSTYPYCIDCEVFTVTVCAGESILMEEGYHKNVVGVTTDCYAYYYGSRGASMCQICRKVIEQYGQHWCREVHKKCSKGNYDVCPMQVL